MDNIIVNVNGEDITVKQLEAAVARFIIQMEEDEECDFEPTRDNMKYIKTEVLNQLIERSLLLQLARKEGLEVTHDAIRRNIELMRSNFESEEEWRANLASLHIPENGLVDAIGTDMLLEKFLNEKYLTDIHFGENELKDYFEKNRDIMKEPDLYSFYEAYAENADKVKLAYHVMQNHEDIAYISREFSNLGIDFHNHTDLPAFRIPEEILKVLADMETGKLATMQAPDTGMLVFKLTRKTIGKKMDYNEIKEKLAEYLIQKAKTEITDNIIRKEMDRAKIEYRNVTFLEKA